MSTVPFVVARPDGNIYRSGTCDESILSTQADDIGDQVLVGEGSPRTHYVANGQIIAFTPEQQAARSSLPHYPARWDNTLMAWVDLRSLEDMKAAAWELVKIKREAALAVPAVTSHGVAYSIPKDKGNLHDRIKSLEAAIALGAADGTTTAIWRDLNNVDHALNITGYLLLAAEMGARGQPIYEHSWALDGQIKAATSKEELEAIDLEAGWPV